MSKTNQFSKPLDPYPFLHEQHWYPFYVLVVVLLEHLARVFYGKFIRGPDKKTKSTDKTTKELLYDYKKQKPTKPSKKDIESIENAVCGAASAANGGDEIRAPSKARPIKAPRTRRQKSKAAKRRQKQAIEAMSDEQLIAAMAPVWKMSGMVNMYDLVKIWAVVTMLCDHSGYFRIVSDALNPWTRAVGRAAAPCFFYLAGFHSRHRFRWKTFSYGTMMFTCNAYLGLYLNYTAWESIITILVINLVFEYGAHYLIELDLKVATAVHLCLFGVLWYVDKWLGKKLNLMYGGFPFMWAIAGYMRKHKHPLAACWILGSMSLYTRSSLDSFGKTPYLTALIMAMIVLDVLMFWFLTGKDFPIFEHLGPVKDAMIYVSRNALLVYCVHLMIFDLMFLTKYCRQGKF